MQDVSITRRSSRGVGAECDRKLFAWLAVMYLDANVGSSLVCL